MVAKANKKSQISLPKAKRGARNLGRTSSILYWVEPGWETKKLEVCFKGDESEHRDLLRLYKKNGWMLGTGLFILTKTGKRLLTELELRQLRRRIRRGFGWEGLRGKKVYRYRLIEILRNDSARLKGLHGHHIKSNPNAKHWTSALATYDYPDGIQWVAVEEHEELHRERRDQKYYRFPDSCKVGSTLQLQRFQDFGREPDSTSWEVYIQDFWGAIAAFQGQLNSPEFRRRLKQIDDRFDISLAG